jgi:hypothetical protein
VRHGIAPTSINHLSKVELWGFLLKVTVSCLFPHSTHLRGESGWSTTIAYVVRNKVQREAKERRASRRKLTNTVTLDQLSTRLDFGADWFLMRLFAAVSAAFPAGVIVAVFAGNPK